MTKQEKVWWLNAFAGEERAAVIQQVADAEKAEAFEAFFKTDVIGHKSTYKPT